MQMSLSYLNVSNPYPIIPNKISTILKKYGANAHLYLPGVGTVSNFTAGNFEDSSGTIPATIDGSIGLVKDANSSENASQATLVNKPTLRLTSSKYKFEIGNLKYLSLTPLFQMSDDFCIISGVATNSTAIENAIYAQSNGSNNALPELMFNRSGQLGIYAFGGGGTLSSFGGPNNTGAGPIVASAVSKSSVCSVRRNGVQVTSTTFTGTYNTATTAAIGAYPTLSVSEFLMGDIYPTIVIKGTVEQIDIVALEKWVGSLSGVLL